MNRHYTRGYRGNLPKVLREMPVSAAGVERIKGRYGGYTYRTTPWINATPPDGQEATFYDLNGRPENG